MIPRGSIGKHLDRFGRASWRIRLTIDGDRKSLGLYDTEQEAREVLAAALKQIGIRPRTINAKQVDALGELRRMKPLSWPEHGGVYFVVASGRVKIGYATSSVAARLAKLQSGCPTRLHLVAVGHGGQKEEAALHLQFDMDRLAGGWFRASEEMVRIVRTYRQHGGESSADRGELTSKGVA